MAEVRWVHVKSHGGGSAGEVPRLEGAHPLKRPLDSTRRLHGGEVEVDVVLYLNNCCVRAILEISDPLEISIFVKLFHLSIWVDVKMTG